MASQVLKDSLRKYPIPGPIQEALLAELWGVSRSASQNTTDMSAYFEYYSKRVQRSLLSGTLPFVQDHLDIVANAKEIKSGKPRGDIHRELSQQPGITVGDDEINDAIDLCASLLVMTEIELRESQVGLSGRTPIRWRDKSLEATLRDHFDSQSRWRVDSPKLGRLFTACNIHRISGIAIKWTTNLTDHLRLVDDDRAVCIFHCASFLKFQNGLDNTPFPRGLVKETLNTLALLFPSNDNEANRWLRSQKKLASIDSQLGRCGFLRTQERQIGNFPFWHDRLAILKQAFDESHPRTLSQWWLDRRNGVQWYTFWVAILVFIVTIFFGIVQSVEGALQVYLSYQALHQETHV